MDFKDWRKPPDKITGEPQASITGKYRGKRFFDYVEEQIREAQARGEFDNLPGFGKPLDLDSNQFAGDKALAYSMLTQNGFAPPERELNRKILTLNLMTPSSMHMPMFEVEKLVQQFRQSCPVFE